MTRKTFSETRKSKWLNEKDKKARKEPKPQFPLQNGVLLCKRVLENGKPCAKSNQVTAYSQVEERYPDSVFWVVTRCDGCGGYLAGYAILGTDSKA